MLVLSLIGGLFSLGGGLLVLWKEEFANKIITSLIAFGAGAFLAAALLDILPEALEMTSEPHPILLAVTVGFVGFFALERFIMKFIKPHHGGEGHSDHTETLPFLLVLGDSLHNILDGVVMAVAYAANPALGLSAALAIAAHEVPQEIGDFSILLSLGWEKRKVLLVNVLQSLLTIPGAFLGFYLGRELEFGLPLLLGGAAGIFIYICASDLIPELHHRSGHKQFGRIILPLVLGIVAVYFLSQLAHS